VIGSGEGKGVGEYIGIQVGEDSYMLMWLRAIAQDQNDGWDMKECILMYCMDVRVID
jgi:hypothetical protein